MLGDGTLKLYGGRFSLLPIQEVFYKVGNENKFEFVLKILSEKGKFKVKRGITILNEPIFDDNNAIIGGKLGKESNRKIPTLKDGNLAKIPTTLYPFVLYIIDREEQVILFEYNSDAFPNELSVFNYLSSILNRELWREGLEAKINPLSSKGFFWELVNEADKIYSVHFALNAPNMLGIAYDNLKDILMNEKQESNANKLEFIKTNDAGELKIKDTRFHNEAVGWIEDGAGEWALTLQSKMTGNRKKRIKNTEQLTTFEIELQEVIDDDMKKIMKIKENVNLGKHKIKGRKK